MSYLDYAFVLGRILYGGFFVLGGLNHFQHLGMMSGFVVPTGVPAAMGDERGLLEGGGQRAEVLTRPLPSDLRLLVRRLRRVFHELGAAPFHLVPRQILLVRRDRPAIPEWIGERAGAVTPELIGHL